MASSAPQQQIHPETRGLELSVEAGDGTHQLTLAVVCGALLRLTSAPTITLSLIPATRSSKKTFAISPYRTQLCGLSLLKRRQADRRVPASSGLFDGPPLHTNFRGTGGSKPRSC